MIYLILNKIIISGLWLSGSLFSAGYLAGGPWLGVENCQLTAANLPINNDRPPAISASAAAVLVPDSNFWLFEDSAQEQRSIASISKLMTALVFLDTNPDWSDFYTIQREDSVSGGRLHLFLGDTLSLRDLFYTAMISSDNGASTALVRSTGLSQEEFVVAMNRRAEDMGLFSTRFVDPTGLSDENVSTAKDVARLAKAALSKPAIAEALIKAEHRFTTREGRDKLILSTVDLIRNNSLEDLQLLSGKTGYTNSAGYCFVGRFLDEENREVLVAVLGTDNRQDRFQEALQLASWAMTNCHW